VPEYTKHPPDPGGAEVGPGPVVDHDVVAVAEAQCRHPFGEPGRRREHVRQRGPWVTGGFDVEEHGAGYVSTGILGRRVAPAAGQVHGPVHHADPGIAEVVGEPIRRDQCPLDHERSILGAIAGQH
jgi:hypothetical protein